jgi:hypothetical protein
MRGFRPATIVFSLALALACSGHVMGQYPVVEGFPAMPDPGVPGAFVTMPAHTGHTAGCATCASGAPVAGYAAFAGDDPFCYCSPTHPWFWPGNGYSNQRYQLFRQMADKHRLPKPYMGDSWLTRYTTGGVTATGAPSAFGP